MLASRLPKPEGVAELTNSDPLDEIEGLLGPHEPVVDRRRPVVDTAGPRPLARDVVPQQSWWIRTWPLLGRATKSPDAVPRDDRTHQIRRATAGRHRHLPSTPDAIEDLIERRPSAR